MPSVVPAQGYGYNAKNKLLA